MVQDVWAILSQPSILGISPGSIVQPWTGRLFLASPLNLGFYLARWYSQHLLLIGTLLFTTM